MCIRDSSDAGAGGCSGRDQPLGRDWLRRVRAALAPRPAGGQGAVPLLRRVCLHTLALRAGQAGGA
eukprot:9025348-Alexandrium_andersonii.AAC.1